MKKITKLVVLMVGLAVTVALSMALTGEAEAKKRKPPKPPTTTNQPTPTLPTSDFRQPIPEVYEGESVVRAWGNNFDGQLGNGTTSNTPSQPSVSVSDLSGVEDISAGEWHSLALKEDGTVWAWGQNAYGQLGDGTTYSRSKPEQVKNLSEVKAIAGGYHHSLALKEDGTVWAWGWNAYGELGDGTTTQSDTPVLVSDLSGVEDISAGAWHSLALKEDGTVWAWGRNAYGELGDGTTTQSDTPVQVKGEPPTNAPPSSAAFPPWNDPSGFKDISAGERHSLALKEDGTVWAWGNNGGGQLGDGTTTQSDTPVGVSDLSGVTAISAGEWHSLALRETGSVFAWGANDRGQLGDGTTTDRKRRVLVSSLSEVKTIDAGSFYSLALKEEGTVRAWGANSEDGQLGDGTTTDRNTPVQVSSLSGVKDISGGGRHSLAKVLKPPVAHP